MHDLSLYALELIENSLRAKATVVDVCVGIDKERDLLWLSVEDNGEGIQVSPERALNPFYTTKRAKKVGLGLSLLKEVVEMAQGDLTLSRSEELGGAAVRARMQLTHVNRPPLGDFAATISAMILTNPRVDFRLSISSGERSYRFRLSEFARNNGLNSVANVELASAAFGALRAELEVWKRYDLMCSKEKWQAVMRELPLCTEDGNLDQGVDA